MNKYLVIMKDRSAIVSADFAESSNEALSFYSMRPIDGSVQNPELVAKFNSYSCFFIEDDGDD